MALASLPATQREFPDRGPCCLKVLGRICVIERSEKLINPRTTNLQSEYSGTGCLRATLSVGKASSFHLTH